MISLKCKIKKQIPDFEQTCVKYRKYEIIYTYRRLKL